MTALPAACRERVSSLAVEEMSCRKETHFQIGVICERLFSSERKVVSQAGASKDARF